VPLGDDHTYCAQHQRQSRLQARHLGLGFSRARYSCGFLCFFGVKPLYFNKLHYVKKRLLLLIFLLCAMGPVAAQVSLGPSVGIISGNFSGDAPKKAKYRPKTGYIVGIRMDFYIKEDVMISLDPGFISTGARLQYPDATTEAYRDSIVFDFSTITIPVVLRILSNNRKWHFDGGMEANFPVTLRAEDGAEEVDLMSDVRKVGLNIVFGIGYRVPVGRSHLALNLSYAQGLLNLVDQLDEDEKYLPRIKSTSLRFTLAWLFQVSRDDRVQ
jgi:hypothetical protein